VHMPRVGAPALEELDYALVRLAEPIGAAPIALGKDTDAGSKPRGWIELPEAEWPFADQTALFIIQHPDGSPMALALDLEARMEVNANKTRVTYQTGTQPGSSGAPCFNQFWDLIALHHAGDPLYPELAPGAFNEGIPIHRIVERLKRNNAADGLTIV
jgi:trypsin-like peptidase